MNYLLLLIPIALIALMIALTKKTLEQSKKDWETLHGLEERANKANSKEDIAAVHAELVEKGNKIFNKYVRARLNVVDGYLRGKYQQFKDKQ